MRTVSHVVVLLVVGGWSAAARSAPAAKQPTAEQALALRPAQSDVTYDRPGADAVARCRVEPLRADGYTGWIVRDPNGTMIRRFIDTNKDNVVDIWCYYHQGSEVYRDIDSNFNRKADQYRWYNAAGTRWAVDRNEDRRIDFWRRISAEEVSREVVRALAEGDYAILAPLMLTDRDLNDLGIDAASRQQLGRQLATAQQRFAKLVSSIGDTVNGSSRWVRFDGSMPALVPGEAFGSKRDITVHQNVVAVVETAGKSSLLSIGEMVRVGAAWRLVDLPKPLGTDAVQVAEAGFFLQSPAAVPATSTGTELDSTMQKLLGELQELDRSGSAATDARAQADYHAKRAALMEKLAAAAQTPEEREQWVRQLADSIAAAVQSGSYDAGVERLEGLAAKLKKQDPKSSLVAYVTYRQLSADYGLKLKEPKANFQKVHENWLGQLRGFIEQFPKADDTPDAMLQVAVASEFAGDDAKARQWYRRLASEFPDSTLAKKASGALRRLDLVGKRLELKGHGLDRRTVDTSDFRGKVLVVVYWATWCQPCKADLERLKTLYSKYGRDGLQVIGVNLDQTARDASGYLQQARLTWPHIFEPGGLDSPPALEYGIVSLPSMFLVDKTGKVVNRGVHAAELEGELKKLL